MNFPRLFSRSAPALALFVVPGLVLPLGGCIFIKAPDPIPVPAPVPTPYGVQFDSTEGQPKGTPLNNQEGATPNPALPDAFRVALIASGQELVLQSLKRIPAPVTTVPATAGDPADGSDGPPDGPPDGEVAKPQVILGAADTLNPVRLAGILVPTGNQTGAQEAIDAIQKLIAGKDIDVDIDPVFPTDIDNKRRVQIFFIARDAPFTGERVSLNRILVLSGHAIVDLHSPTSFDQRQWLYDETHARENNLGLWTTDTFRQLQQRVKLPSTGAGARSSVGLTVPAPGQAAGTQGTVVIAPGAPTTTTTTTASPSASPGAPMTSASPSASPGAP